MWPGACGIATTGACGIATTGACGIAAVGDFALDCVALCALNSSSVSKGGAHVSEKRLVCRGMGS